MYKLCVVSLLVFTLIGCGSEDKSSEIWYIEDGDIYMEFLSNGSVTLYECTVHDGYRANIDVNLTHNENQLFIGSTIYRIDKSEESIEFYEENQLAVRGVLAYELPSTCQNDAIEITEVVYTSNDDETIVYFDYRLTSIEEADLVVFVDFDAEGEGHWQIDASKKANSGLHSNSYSFILSQENVPKQSPYSFHVSLESSGLIYEADYIVSQVNAELDNLDTDCLTCLVSNPHP